MKKLEKIIDWAKNKDNIRVLILSGSLAGKGKKDNLSDYDIAIYGSDFDFIKNDNWLNEIQDFWVCIHDEFKFWNRDIPTRLTIFDVDFKVDFSFHPLELLKDLSNAEKLPDDYNIGCEILLDKDEALTKMPKPTYEGFKIKKPDSKEFKKNMDEFWFEVYHIAKYLHRGDLWTAKITDLAAKKWLRQMLEWHQAMKRKWNFSPKDNGKGMKDWIDKNIWEESYFCFGKFDKDDSWKALQSTIKIYRKVATGTAHSLHCEYNQKLDDYISQFVEKIKNLKNIQSET